MDKEKLPYSDNVFDEVYAAYLLEHLKRPFDFLLECKRVLKKNGKLVILTDNASYWQYAKDSSVHLGKYERVGRTGKTNKETQDDRHYALFTEQHLLNYAGDLDLKDVEIWYVKLNYNELENRFRGFLQKCINRILRRTFLWRMAYPNIKLEGRKNG